MHIFVYDILSLFPTKRESLEIGQNMKSMMFWEQYFWKLCYDSYKELLDQVKQLCHLFSCIAKSFQINIGDTLLCLIVL